MSVHPLFIMARNPKVTALSPGQVLSHQRMLRMPHLDMMKNQKLIGTWNGRSLFAAERLDNAILEMKRMEIDILGITETRWPNSGICRKNGETFYYSGNNNPDHRNGVGFIVSKEIDKFVRNVVAYSDRIILLQLSAKPININIVQAYATTMDGTETEVEQFYEQIREVLQSLKSQNINVLWRV